jgi:bifunctional phosphoglucose/phosphomannose isomerase
MEIDMSQSSKMPVSDDPELAKILSGVNASNSNDNTNDDAANDGLQYEGLEQMPDAQENIQPEQPIEQTIEQPVEQTVPVTSFAGLDLDGIKSHALEDLRPLVDKLTVTNEEKFDIYLLLLRSSDDDTLIEPAYNAARAIEDETKRANALLDVIKEIDYFKSK